MPEKPDSKRGRVRTHFREHGEGSVLEFGQTLGIKAARIKRWIKQWGEGPAAPRRGEPPVKVKPLPKEFLGKPRVNLRIYAFKDWTKTGTLLEEGPEQSKVRWDNGNEVIVANSWIEKLPPEKDPKRRTA